MKKRLLSALLALVMVLALLPVSVFADDPDPETPEKKEEVVTPAGEDTDKNVEKQEENKPKEKKEETPAAQNNAGISPQTDSFTPEEGVTTVRYQKLNNNGRLVNGTLSGVITGAPGYYAEKTSNGITTYQKVDGCVISSDNKYRGSRYSLSTGTVTVVGSASVTFTGATGTVKVYPANSGTSNVSIGGTGMTSLTVTDDYYGKDNETRSSANAITLTSLPTFANDKKITLSLSHVTVGAITMTENCAHTVTLVNANTGAISLGAASGDPKKADAKQILNVNQDNAGMYRNSVIGGAISVTGNSASVTLVDTTASSGVTLNGTGTSLTVGGSSSIGTVTLSDHLTNQSTTTQLSTVTVNRGTVASVKTNGNHAAKVKVDVKKDAAVTGEIDLTGKDSGNTAENNADVIITSATVGGVKINGGSLKVNGPSAKVGGTNGVTLGGSATFTLTSTDNEIKGLGITSTSVKISIPAEPSNTLQGDSLDPANPATLNYTGSTNWFVGGGEWVNTIVPKAALDSSLAYELDAQGAGGVHRTYYTQAQLPLALVAENKLRKAETQLDGTVNLAHSLYSTTDVGDVSGGTGQFYNLQFKNGSTLWGTMLVYREMQILLPSKVNNVNVTYWADINRGGRAANTMYSTPSVSKVGAGGTWELNASGGVTNGDATKLTDARASASWSGENDDMGVVKAALSGTVITLTGAVPKGDSNITLYLTTDAVKEGTGADAGRDVPVVLAVGAVYYSETKTLKFSNVANDSLGYGTTLEENETVLRLSNGTKYTLNGSGLKERSNKIHVSSSSGSYAISNYGYIEVNVQGISSTYKTLQDQQGIVDLIKGAAGSSTAAKFDWSSSPAMQEAVNAALATITDQQVAGYITAAQRAAWGKKYTGTYDANVNGPSTGYTEVLLVPYLQVNLTNYVPGSTVSATLVPSWRVEVRQPSSGAPASASDFANVFADSKKFDQPANAYIAKTGTSLGTLRSDLTNDGAGGVVVKFDSATFFNAGSATDAYYMNQDSTYAYRCGYDNTNSASTGYLLTHAGSNGLGSVVINTTEPLVKTYASNAAGAAVVGYYHTLQAAVNDVKNTQHIDVNENYTGSMNVSVTGTARQFTIQAHGNNVVIANASGGLVSLNGTGGEYTVQLNRDATAVVDGTTATIAVNGVANGSATVSATTAKSGTTVTVTCAPVVGYRTGSVSVSAHMTATNTNSVVSATKVSDNVYSFKVPQGADKITVTPNFVVGTVSAVPFTDVSTDHWAYNSVKYVYDNGLMNGVNTAGTQFGGTQTLNRAMVATILYRAAGSPYVGAASGFSDVANNTWYSQAVSWASQNGIVTGYTNGTFQPTWAITRQELATMLYRYNTTYKGRATTGSTTLANFPDQGNVSDWATAGMQWAVGNGIVNGITNGYSTTLSPAGSATRYEAATMLMRYGQGMGL